MTGKRVDQLDPRILAAIDAALPDRQRWIAVEVAGRALEALPAYPVSLDWALGTYRAGLWAGGFDDSLRGTVHSLTVELEDSYLDMFDDEKLGGRTEGWELAFAAARGAAALDHAADPDPRQAAAEAAYEAQFVVETTDELLAVILGASAAQDEAVEAIEADLSSRAKKPITLVGLADRWVSFARNLEGGYQLTIDDYTNDLSTRNVLLEAIGRLGPTQRTWLEALVVPGDESFRTATEEDVRSLIAHFDHPGPGWWWRRIPRNLGRLADDFDPFG